ncbi:hypothetical protein [Sphingomonas sp.]|uniref:hypothetical protein n=1 Tax=Sphingomonas sp. TaxID=28214 RepID=UPI003CC6B801
MQQTEASVITNPSQFLRSDGWPDLAAGATRNVYAIETLANADRDARQQSHRDHLQDAITLATAVSRGRGRGGGGRMEARGHAFTQREVPLQQDAARQQLLHYGPERGVSRG